MRTEALGSVPAFGLLDLQLLQQIRFQSQYRFRVIELVTADEENVFGALAQSVYLGGV